MRPTSQETKLQPIWADLIILSPKCVVIRQGGDYGAEWSREARVAVQVKNMRLLWP
jgi:uncharacterized protein YheU (UPF0270 family)